MLDFAGLASGKRFRIASRPLVPETSTETIRSGPDCGSLRLPCHWPNLAGLAPGQSGPIFRRILTNGKIHPSEGLTGHAIGKIIQECAADVCLNPNKVSGHSLRHGFITEAKNQKLDLRDVMTLSKHRDVKTVMGYQSIGDLFGNPAAHLTRGLIK